MSLRFAALTGALLALLVVPAMPVAAELAPHRAFYVMSLASTKPHSAIVDVQGAMAIEVSETCDGWISTQRLKLRLTNEEGPVIETDSNFSSWESKDGLKYTFTTRSLRNGVIIEELRGRARLQAAGKSGAAEFTVPEEKRFELPAGTVFPTEHIIHLVERAAAGDKRVSRIVFDGATLEGPAEVNAVVLDRIKPAAGAEAVPLMRRPGWRMRLAFFPITKQAAQPEYEIGIGLLDNGVARELALDYGEFTIDAHLDSLEGLPKPAC